MNSKAVWAIGTVYVGCMLNNVFLEYLVKLDSGIGNLITFLQFLLIATVGLVTTAKFFTVKPKIGVRSYVVLVSLFFATSVMNNWAFSFNIAVPLHMIFRSGSLIANMLLGILILNLKYPLRKYVSVFMITGGIVICTLMSAATPKVCNNCDDVKLSDVPNVDDADSFFWWCVGIFILSAALLLSARMGIYQQELVSSHGKHPDEMLFYTHFLSMPFFAIYGANIVEHWSLAMDSESVGVVGGVAVPIVVLYLIGNVLTQYLCISSVYVLTSEVSSLTLTLVITLRKFASLIFSIWYFDNEFTLLHWFGTALVFVGTLIFADVLYAPAKSPASNSSPKKKSKTS